MTREKSVVERWLFSNYFRIDLGPERFVAVSEAHPNCRGTMCHTVIIQRRGRKGEPRKRRINLNLSSEALAALVACGVKQLQKMMEAG